jgi:hypothetical protein
MEFMLIAFMGGDEQLPFQDKLLDLTAEAVLAAG